jgi:hypothetical protein
MSTFNVSEAYTQQYQHDEAELMKIALEAKEHLQECDTDMLELAVRLSLQDMDVEEDENLAIALRISETTCYEEARKRTLTKMLERSLQDQEMSSYEREILLPVSHRSRVLAEEQEQNYVLESRYEHMIQQSLDEESEENVMIYKAITASIESAKHFEEWNAARNAIDEAQLLEAVMLSERDSRYAEYQRRFTSSSNCL